eukprot:3037531-Pleurochrysis_carterae.AAC.3
MHAFIWRVLRKCLLLGIGLERPSGLGRELTISYNTNDQRSCEQRRRTRLGRAWAVAQGKGAQRAGAAVASG